MTDNERMIKVATATPAEKARIDAIFNHADTAPKSETDVRTCTFTEAAKRLSVSRPTIYRLAQAGHLKVVPLLGVNRILISSLVDFASKGVKG